MVAEIPFAVLSAATPVAAVLGAGAEMRLYPQSAPQESDAPYAIFELTGPAPETIAGLNGVCRARLRVVVYHVTYDGARDLGDKVALAMAQAAGLYGRTRLHACVPVDASEDFAPYDDGADRGLFSVHVDSELIVEDES